MRPTRRGVLTGAAAMLGLPALLGVGGNPSRRLLIVNAEGGWDVTFALDSKLGVAGVDGPMPEVKGTGTDVELVMDFGQDQRIQVNPQRRPNVAGLFQMHADKICVINGLWVGAITHVGARVRMLTGTSDLHAPDLGMMVGVERGATDPLTIVDFSGLARFGPYASTAARFGRKGQLGALLDPMARMTPTQNPEYRGQTLADDDRQALLDYLLADREAQPFAQMRNGDVALADRIEAVGRSEILRETVVPTGPTSSLRSQVELALDLFESGVCHSAMVQTDGTWDSHAGAGIQHGMWNDTAFDLAYLITELEQRGMLDTVTVAVLSEMSRTPTRNIHDGTDHWPHTSAMLFGAGIAGGRMLGATDDVVVSKKVDFASGEVTESGEYLRPENLAAGLLETLDVDPDQWLPGVVPYRAHQA